MRAIDKLMDGRRIDRIVRFYLRVSAVVVTILAAFGVLSLANNVDTYPVLHGGAGIAYELRNGNNFGAEYRMTPNGYTRDWSVQLLDGKALEIHTGRIQVAFFSGTN